MDETRGRANEKRPWTDLFLPDSAGILPLSRLDWAIAGTSSLLQLDGVRHCVWHHWIDSRTPDAEGVADEGDMFDDPSDGALALERGHMVNPATGAETAYEEAWRSEPIMESLSGCSDASPGEAPVTCLVLKWEGGGGPGGQRPDRPRRGLLVRLGQYCQVFARDGEALSVERLRWAADTQTWQSLVRIGEQALPTQFATYLAHEARLGDEVSIGGEVWTVVEKA